MCYIQFVFVGLGASWHLSHIEVEDCASGQRYMFSCNRWLSRSEDDKQICRELSCANLPSPGAKDKISKSLRFYRWYFFQGGVERFCLQPLFDVHLVILLDINSLSLTEYEVQVSTSDKKDAGTIHNAWLILEGDQRSSKELIMENGSRNKILRK